jgi:hypothetical protein
MRSTPFLLLLLLLLSHLLAACGPDTSGDAPGQKPDKTEGTVRFRAHVMPVFEQHCTGCHFGFTAETFHATFLPEDPAASPRCVDGTPMLTPGDPSRSGLWIKVTDEDLTFECNGEMPPTGEPLSVIDAEATEVLRRWILGGAKND